MKLPGNISHYDPKTICKFCERKKLAIKKNSQKTILYKQTQAKLSPTKMELCGGENAYRKGLYYKLSHTDLLVLY